MSEFVKGMFEMQDDLKLANISKFDAALNIFFTRPNFRLCVWKHLFSIDEIQYKGIQYCSFGSYSDYVPFNAVFHKINEINESNSKKSNEISTAANQNIAGYIQKCALNYDFYSAMEESMKSMKYFTLE